MPRGYTRKTVASTPLPKAWDLYQVWLGQSDRVKEYYIQAPSAGAALRAALPRWHRDYEVDPSNITIKCLGQMVIYDNSAAT
jgi:hypothetical protein